MTDSRLKNKSKTLHDLIENEFRQLIDVIEQKQISHENINTAYKQNKASPEEEIEPLEIAAKRLKQHSHALGAETLAEYFQELESSMQKGNLSTRDELLRSISDEFENVKAILSESAN